MTDQRITAFSDLGDFTPKTKPAPHADQRQLEKVAEQAGFVSRQTPKAPKPAAERKMGPRNPHRTGRDKQLNIKASPEVIERLHQVADAEKQPLGAMLEKLLDAYERQA